MVIEVISKSDNGKAFRPPGIIIDMMKASEVVDTDLLTELINDIADAQIPQKWRVSSTVNSYKGKEYPIARGNYRGQKLLEHHEGTWANSRTVY